MKRLLITALLCAISAFLVADETESKKKPDPLIEAARAAKAKRKKPSTKVITNKDVKKSKGKLIVIDSKEPEGAEKTAGPARSSLEKHDDRYKARLAAEEHLAESEKNVAELQKELELIEQRYYEANDPNYRDTVLQDRFAQAKRQLEDARAALADARDELTKLEAPQP